jgi:hypothetical protein
MALCKSDAFSPTQATSAESLEQAVDVADVFGAMRAVHSGGAAAASADDAQPSKVRASCFLAVTLDCLQCSALARCQKLNPSLPRCVASRT